MRNRLPRILMVSAGIALGVGFALWLNSLDLTPTDGWEWLCFLPVPLFIAVFIAVGWLLGRKYENSN